MQKKKAKLLLILVINFVFGCLSPFCLLLLGQNAFEPIPELLPINNEEISIVAVGDIMLDSWVIEPIERNGLTYPFSCTVNHFESADVAIANLEAPFTLVGETFEKTFTFKVPPNYVLSLKSGGIDVVTLANNHIMDYGVAGLLSTIETLDSAGIKHSGAGRNLYEAHQPAILDISGKRIAFFGYSMTFPQEFYAKKDSAGTAYPEPARLQNYIKAWRDSVDFIITSFHWGAEKRETPKDYQIYFAHLAIDSGADLVLGHHPHVLQGLEIYKNRLIAYSLGNFAFGSYSKYAVDSIILKVYLRDDGLYTAHCIPINVDNREVEFQPKIAYGEQKQRIIKKLQELSFALNGSLNIVSATGLIFGNWKDVCYEAAIDTSSWPGVSPGAKEKLSLEDH